MHRPSARVAARIQAHSVTRLRLLSWGEDDRVPNEGDVLILGDIGVAGNNVIEVGILIMGREMGQLLPAFIAAAELYEANKDYLSSPVSWDPASGDERPSWKREREEEPA